MQTKNEQHLTPNDRDALRVYRSLCEQRAAGTLPAVAALGGETLRLPRVRLAGDVDLTVADSTCAACGGQGIAGSRTLSDSSGEVRVPVVCGCVIRGGGLRPDALDLIHGGAA
jgi:hypothetical protein